MKHASIPRIVACMHTIYYYIWRAYFVETISNHQSTRFIESDSLKLWDQLKKLLSFSSVSLLISDFKASNSSCIEYSYHYTYSEHVMPIICGQVL